SALAMGDAATADELLAVVEGMPPGLRPPYLEAQARRLRARVQGNEPVAGGYAAAAGQFHDMEIPFWEAVSRLEQAEALVAVGEGEAAAEPLRAARAEFERLEARRWLARADALTEQVGASIAV